MENILKNAHLTAAEIALLTTTNYKSVTISIDNRSRKRMGEINHDEDDEWKEFFSSIRSIYAQNLLWKW